MTLRVWKPFIRVINVKLPQEKFHYWFLFSMMSEICHIRPYCNSRHALAWIMTLYILFIIGLLYGLLNACLYNNKYCPFSRELSFLLLSVSFPHCPSMCWGILSEHCQGLPQHGQLRPLGMGCSWTPAPLQSAPGWSACCKMPLPFATCSGCQLSSNRALIPQTVIPAW